MRKRSDLRINRGRRINKIILRLSRTGGKSRRPSNKKKGHLPIDGFPLLSCFISQGTKS